MSFFFLLIFLISFDINTSATFRFRIGWARSLVILFSDPLSCLVTPSVTFCLVGTSQMWSWRVKNTQPSLFYRILPNLNLFVPSQTSYCCLVQILKVNLFKFLEGKILSRLWGWSFVKILMLKFGPDFVLRFSFSSRKSTRIPARVAADFYMRSQEGCLCCTDAMLLPCCCYAICCYKTKPI